MNGATTICDFEAERETRLGAVPAPGRHGIVATLLCGAVMLNVAPALAVPPMPAHASAAVTPSSDVVLKPFTARFAVSWRGVGAATMTLDLREESPGRYVYSSRNVARGVLKLAYPGEARQTSTLEIANAGHVRPLRFRGDDGSSNASKSVALDFDWSARRVTGSAEGVEVDLPIEDGVHDALSSQVALMADLAAGRTPRGFTLVDDAELKPYVYQCENGQALETPAGRFETIACTSRREGSKRATRVWYAKGAGYAPVRAERTREGRVELAMRLVELKRP